MGAILIVDDSRVVRMVGRSALESAGFAVLTADDGVAGMAAFSAHSEVIVAVILDVEMPVMGGEGFFLALRAVSMVPVVVSTSRTPEEIESLALARAEAYIQKPWTLLDLLGALKRVGVIDGA